MEGIGTYILSAAAAGILCAVIASLGGKGSHGSILKLMCGIVLTAVIIRPITTIAPVNLNRYLHQLDREAEAVVAAGIQNARDTLRDRISQALEAYIINKAADLGLHITVALALDDQEPVPASVVISGTASPYARSALSAILRDDLGIPTESQIWT